MSDVPGPTAGPMTPDVPPVRRRWRRALSLRGLMVLVLLAGAGLGWLAYRLRLASDRREAVALIRAGGGSVRHWDEFPQQSGFWINVYRRTGWELAREVAEVDLGPPPPQPPPAPGEPEPPAPPSRDETFRRLGRLGRIDTIRLDGLVLAPGERAVLAAAGLRSLELMLTGTEVPPGALDGLAEIGSLRSLNVFVARKVDPSRPPALPAPVLARVGGLVQLRSLDIHGFVDFPGVGPTTFGRLDDLRSLRLDPSPGDGAFLDGLAAGRRLDTLVLPNTRATDDQLRRLVERQPGLRFLTVNGSLLTDPGVGPLAELPRLQGLGLRGRPGDGPGITDAGLIRLGRLGSLQGLAVTCGRFDGRGLDALAGLTQLRGLTLGEFATVADPAALPRLLAGRPWRSLGFRGPGIDDSNLPTILASIGPLDSLSLARSGVTDAGMAALAAAPVGMLTLTGTAVTDLGLKALLGKTSAYLIVARGSGLTPAQIKALRALGRGRGIGLDLGPPGPEDE